MENAVQDFILDSMQDGDPVGMFNQTIERVAMSTFLASPQHDLWLAWVGQDVKAYLLASITKEVDNRFCYWIHQAWVDKGYRHDKKFILDSWVNIKAHAKRHHCSHLVMASIRNGWTRYLGDEVQPYITLLKKDLED